MAKKSKEPLVRTTADGRQVMPTTRQGSVVRTRRRPYLYPQPVVIIMQPEPAALPPHEPTQHPQQQQQQQPQLRARPWWLLVVLLALAAVVGIFLYGGSVATEQKDKGINAYELKREVKAVLEEARYLQQRNALLPPRYRLNLTLEEGLWRHWLLILDRPHPSETDLRDIQKELRVFQGRLTAAQSAIVEREALARAGR